MTLRRIVDILLALAINELNSRKRQIIEGRKFQNLCGSCSDIPRITNHAGIHNIPDSIGSSGIPRITNHPGIHNIPGSIGSSGISTHHLR